MIERARRKEEIPLLKSKMEEEKVEHKSYFVEQQELSREAHRAQHETDLKEKAKITTLYPHWQAYRAAKLADRRKEFDVRMAKRDELREKKRKKMRLDALKAKEAELFRLQEVLCFN